MFLHAEHYASNVLNDIVGWDSICQVIDIQHNAAYRIEILKCIKDVRFEKIIFGQLSKIDYNTGSHLMFKDIQFVEMTLLRNRLLVEFSFRQIYNCRQLRTFLYLLHQCVTLYTRA